MKVESEQIVNSLQMVVYEVNQYHSYLNQYLKIAVAVAGDGVEVEVVAVVPISQIVHLNLSFLVVSV